MKAAAEAWLTAVGHELRETPAEVQAFRIRALVTEDERMASPERAFPGYTDVDDLAAELVAFAVSPQEGQPVEQGVDDAEDGIEPISADVETPPSQGAPPRGDANLADLPDDAVFSTGRGDERVVSDLDLMSHSLLFLAQQTEPASLGTVHDQLVARIPVGQDEQKIYRNGKYGEPEYGYRQRWAITWLVRATLADRSRRNAYVISDAGRNLVARHQGDRAGLFASVREVHHTKEAARRARSNGRPAS